MSAADGPGDYWLVFSGRVHIQARFAPDAVSPGEGLFVRAVAAGGPFLGGGTAVVGCLADAVTWRGRAVLTSPRGDMAALATALVSEFEEGAGEGTRVGTRVGKVETRARGESSRMRR